MDVSMYVPKSWPVSVLPPGGSWRKTYSWASYTVLSLVHVQGGVLQGPA
jgi:hypothetical protein